MGLHYPFPLEDKLLLPLTFPIGKKKIKVTGKSVNCDDLKHVSRYQGIGLFQGSSSLLSVFLLPLAPPLQLCL